MRVFVCVLFIRQLVVLCSFSRFMRMDRSADLGVYMTYNAQQQQQQQQRWRCYLINATEPSISCVLVFIQWFLGNWFAHMQIECKIRITQQYFHRNLHRRRINNYMIEQFVHHKHSKRACTRLLSPLLTNTHTRTQTQTPMTRNIAAHILWIIWHCLDIYTGWHMLDCHTHTHTQCVSCGMHLHSFWRMFFHSGN